MEENKQIIEGFFKGAILFQGKWVTWEFYKDFHRIEEGGFYGDMPSGGYAFVSKYERCFEKELSQFLTYALTTKDLAWQKKIEEVREKLQQITKWKEPQEGAGAEIGALYGAGMYTQYDIDREQHEEEIATVLSLLPPITTKE